MCLTSSGSSITIRAVRDLSILLCLLLCRGPQCSAGTALTAALRRPAGLGRGGTAALWNPLPWLRHALDETTRLGQPIPGLARHSQCCGKVNVDSRVVGGVTASPNEFPWMAAVVNATLEAPFCGGALFNDLYVLTAAHCVWDVGSPAQIEIILGKHHRTENSGNDLRVGVAQIIVHPLYRNVIDSDDIALLKMDRRLTLPIGDNLIAPICLPHRDLFRDNDAIVAGWGETFEGAVELPDYLQKVQLTTIPNWVCEKRHNFTSPMIKPTMICTSAVPKEAEQDACYADSGSGLMVAARHRLRRVALAGIVTWGIGCARPFLPGVYARTTYFLDWILFNTPDATYC